MNENENENRGWLESENSNSALLLALLTLISVLKAMNATLLNGGIEGPHWSDLKWLLKVQAYSTKLVNWRRGRGSARDLGEPIWPLQARSTAARLHDCIGVDWLKAV